MTEDRAEPNNWYLLARQSNGLAEVIEAAGRPDEVKQFYKQAVQAYREALPRYQKRAADSPTSANRRNLADCQGWLGVALRQAGQPEETIKVWREAASVWEKLANESNLPDHCCLLATRYEQLGDVLHEIGRHQEAERAYRDALAVRKKLVADYTRPEDRSALARTQGKLADEYVQSKQSGKAIGAPAQAIELEPKERGH